MDDGEEISPVRVGDRSGRALWSSFSIWMKGSLDLVDAVEDVFWISADDARNEVDVDEAAGREMVPFIGGVVDLRVREDTGLADVDVDAVAVEGASVVLVEVERVGLAEDMVRRRVS